MYIVLIDYGINYDQISKHYKLK